jgi:DNA-binding response OmpR family regulator
VIRLVVEPDPDYAGIIAQTARSGGHEVALVGSEDGARRWCLRERPSLVLMDIPECGGLTLLQELRHELPSVPIVVLSTSDRLSDVIRALEAGADDYVTKPFHPSELRARLRAVCRRGRAYPAGPPRAMDPAMPLDRDSRTRNLSYCDQVASPRIADLQEPMPSPDHEAWESLVSRSDELARRGTSQTHAGAIAEGTLSSQSVRGP